MEKKIVDGIPLKYLRCQPCPECMGKLRAAEEMATIMRDIALAPCLLDLLGEDPADNYPDERCHCPGCNARVALSAWEKAGKGE